MTALHGTSKNHTWCYCRGVMCRMPGIQEVLTEVFQLAAEDVVLHGKPSVVVVCGTGYVMPEARAFLGIVEPRWVCLVQSVVWLKVLSCAEIRWTYWGINRPVDQKAQTNNSWSNRCVLINTVYHMWTICKFHGYYRSPKKPITLWSCISFWRDKTRSNSSKNLSSSSILSFRKDSSFRMRKQDFGGNANISDRKCA